MHIRNQPLRPRGHIPGGFRQVSSVQQLPDASLISSAVALIKANSVQAVTPPSTLATVSVGSGVRSLGSTQLVPDALLSATVLTNVVAGANWAQRSTAPQVIAAYDFSAPPANGGDWTWGSLRAADATHSKVTCEMQNLASYPTKSTIDTAVAPLGSSASLRYDIVSTDGEVGLNWRLAIDDWNFQFDNGGEFWIQWRVRMNQVYAQHQFKAHDIGVDSWNGSYTGPKLNFLSAGPQFPFCAGDDRSIKSVNGFPGAHDNSNTYAAMNVASYGEVETSTEGAVAIDATNAWRSPYQYHGHGLYEGFTTFGQDQNYFTNRNEGILGQHVAAGQFTFATGRVYTDFGTAYPGEYSTRRNFEYQPNQWMTFMLHVILGNWAASGTNSLGNSHPGYQNSIVELYAMYDPSQASGASMRLIHRRTGACLATDPNDGAQGRERYGQFAVTTFMTGKWSGPLSAPGTGDPHGLAQCWYSQIIWSKARPLDPGPWPAFVSGLADFQIRNLTGATYGPTNGKETLHSVLPAEWQGNGGDGLTSEQAIFENWSGGVGDPLGRRLFVHGGGHSAGANNGIYIYDFNGGNRPVGWTIAPNSLSAVASVPTNFPVGGPYLDKKAPSVHTYDMCRFDIGSNRFYRFGGSGWHEGSATPAYYYDMTAQQWSSVAANGGAWWTNPTNNELSVTILHRDDYTKFLYLPGDVNHTAYFINSDGTSVGAGVPNWLTSSNSNGPSAVRLEKDSHWVTVHYGRLTSGDPYTSWVIEHNVDWANNSVTMIRRTHASHATQLLNCSAPSLIYDPDHSAGPCIWIFAMVADMGTTQLTKVIRRMSLADWSVTSYTLTGDNIGLSNPAGQQGSYNRHVWFPQWRVIATAQAYNAPVSIIKLPT